MIRKITPVIALATLVAVSGCARLGLSAGDDDTDSQVVDTAQTSDEPPRDRAVVSENIFTLFNPPQTDNVVKVNRHIWAASLEVLDFLPIQTIDPFTGVIVTGFGTPPGGGRSYRATVLIDDPALDARSLKVSLQTRRGAADATTVRAIEDAILTRARQLRVADSRL